MLASVRTVSVTLLRTRAHVRAASVLAPALARGTSAPRARAAARPTAIAAPPRRHLAQVGPPLDPALIPDIPLTEYLARKWRTHGDKVAMIDALSGRTCPFSELEPRIYSAASALQARGFGAGDTLMLHLPNCPEYLVAYHAALALGGTVTTSNPLYTPHEVRNVM
jgi:hypothetical protein